MMNKHLSVLTDVSASGGLIIGLQEISTILGIALTAVSLFVLIVNFILKLKDRVSNVDKNNDGKISEDEKDALVNDVKKEVTNLATDLTSKIGELKDAIDKIKNNKDGD